MMLIVTPSFPSQSIEASEIVKKTNYNYGMICTEVRSIPIWIKWLMLFLNSATLRFIAKENLEKEGYGSYL
jgi:peptide methionine sulfoxide reductase MsrB